MIIGGAGSAELKQPPFGSAQGPPFNSAQGLPLSGTQGAPLFVG